MKCIYQAVSLLCLLTCVAVLALAQNSAGSLSGTVTDASNAAVAGARVSVKQNATGRIFTTVTTSEGLYAFSNLDVGDYTLTIEQAGFKKVTQQNLIIAISN